MAEGIGLLFWTSREGSVQCGVVDSRPLTAGTEPICGLPFEGNGVSAVHAVLRATPQGHVVRKLTRVGSLAVNGDDTEQSSLNHGDRVTMGDEELIYYRDDVKNAHRLKMTIGRVDWDGTIEVEVDGPLVFIGRDEGEVVIQDHTISGNHLEIAYFGGSNMWICDLDSTNGSFLGDDQLAPLDRREIDVGDPIRLGRVTIQFGEGAPIEEGTHSPQRTVVFPDGGGMA